MKSKHGLMKFSPLAVSILLALPVMVNAADLKMMNGTATMANGVPIININEANANGISHNIYDTLNVGKEGMVFNNSQNGANSTLAGKIAGNSNLVSGTAKVILNEVTSRNQSTLAGMMEVAGDKAHLIIANPNGITCGNCGFINTNKVTITTGTPDIKNGELKGYSVHRGVITTNGLTSNSPTAILARSIVVNGSIISGGELSLVAGNNYIDTNNQVVGTVKASGSRNVYGIDVAKLGGMYANKISLISTENGVGVRNVGVLAAGSDGIQIDTHGRLINNNAQIKSTGAIGVKTNGILDNNTGKIVSNESISIDTNKNAVNNLRAGNIISNSDVSISSGALNNKNGKIAAANTLSINTNNATLNNSGKGIAVGMQAAVVALNTGTLDNSNGQIRGHHVRADSSSVYNNNGIIEAANNIDISSKNKIDNTHGLIRTAEGYIKINVSKNSLINGLTKSADTSSADSLGIIAGKGGIEILATNLNNRDGQIASSGDINLMAQSGVVSNYNGKVLTDKNIYIKASSLTNSSSGMVGKTGVNIDLTNDFTNHIGVVSSEAGDINIRAKNMNNTGGLLIGQNINLTAANNINSNTALIVSQKKLNINAGNTVNNNNSSYFGRKYGFYFGMPDQEGGMISKGGMQIAANKLNNNNSRIIAQAAPLTLAITGALSNNYSMLVGAGISSIQAGTMSSNYSTVHSKGDLSIDTRALSLNSSGNMVNNNATGVIAADGTLNLNIGGSFTNNGWISGKQKVSVNSEGTLFNRNTIHSQNEANVYAKSAINNYRNITSGKKLSVKSNGTIYNSGSMFTEGSASIKGKKVNNAGSSAVLGGRQGLELIADTVTGNGKFVTL